MKQQSQHVAHRDTQASAASTEETATFAKQKPPSVSAEGTGTANAVDVNDDQTGSAAGSTSLTSVDAADGSVWTGADSWLEESCRAELAAAERLLPHIVVLPQDETVASEPQLVEPSPRGAPAPVTWGHRSELKPAKLGMRVVLPPKRVNTRRVCADAMFVCRSDRKIGFRPAVLVGTHGLRICSHMSPALAKPAGAALLALLLPTLRPVRSVSSAPQTVRLPQLAQQRSAAHHQ